MAAIAGRIADTGANIDRIERMARYPVTAIDLHVSGVQTDTLRAVLAAEAAAQGARHRGPAGQPAAPRHAADRHGRRLHADPGRGHRDARCARRPARSEVAGITEAAMRGELDFEQALRERVALLEGLDAVGPRRGLRRASCSPPVPARWCGRCSGWATASRIVSGGFSQITDRLAADLGIDFSRANELEIVDGKLTGRIVGRGRRPGGQGCRAAPVRRRRRRPGVRGDRDRRRRQRHRHAQRRRARHRLQRQARASRRPPTRR